LNLTLESLNDKIDLNCTLNYTICVNAPNVLFSNSLNVGSYYLKAFNYENNVTSKLFINSEPLIVYSKFKPSKIETLQFGSVLPPSLFYTMNCKVFFLGSGFSSHVNPIFRYNNPLNSSQFQEFIGNVLNDTTIEVFVTNIPSNFTSTTIKISLDNRYSFRDIITIPMTSNSFLSKSRNSNITRNCKFKFTNL
jgi:hypothetical protein